MNRRLRRLKGKNLRNLRNLWIVFLMLDYFALHIGRDGDAEQVEDGGGEIH